MFCATRFLCSTYIISIYIQSRSIKALKPHTKTTRIAVRLYLQMIRVLKRKESEEEKEEHVKRHTEQRWLLIGVKFTSTLGETAESRKVGSLLAANP